MKYLTLLTLVLVSINSFSQGQSDNNSFAAFIKINNKQFNKLIGTKYPDFNIKTSYSLTLSNKDLANKVVFINFWAEHCSPCIAETDGLIQLYSKLQKYPDFKFISFSYDPDSTIDKLVKRYNINFKVFHLDRTEFLRLNFNNGIPTSIILDRNGTIRYFVCGGPGNKEQSTRYIMTYVYPQILQLIENK